MADEAERQAVACSNAVRAAELRHIAENCRVVPENPPQTFAQAVQMVWFVHVMFHIEVCTTACGFGRFDQYMWPFYKKDVIDEGILTRDEALELVECLYLKACEVYEVRDTWYATAFAGYPMWQIDAGYVNMGKVVEFVLHNGIDPRTGKLMGLRTGDPREFTNIEQFKDALKKQIIHAYDQIRIGYNLMQSIHMNRYPVIFASMVTAGCVESGKSVRQGGARVSTCGMYVTGAANLADCIAAVEKCVFEDGDVTMDELIAACDANFEGYERLRQLLLNKPEKYGNDSPHVDGIYREMMHYVADEVQSWPDARGGHYAFGIDS